MKLDFINYVGLKISKSGIVIWEPMAKNITPLTRRDFNIGQKIMLIRRST